MNNLSNVKKQYIDYINNIKKNDKISHAYLIELDNYDDDLKYVYFFIKMILCDLDFEGLQKSNNNIIKLIDEGNYPDISIISSDTSIIKKSEIIDLQNEFSNKSLLDNKKIYIIFNAEKLNSSSANTILKFLEEPKENIIAFLLTDNRYHVIETIVSRCQILSLKELSYNYNLDDDKMDFINYLLNPNDFFINYNDLLNNKFSDKSIFKEYLIESENAIISYLSNNDSALKDVFSSASRDKLTNIISIIEDYLSKLIYNVNYKLWIDSFFSSLLGG